MAKAIRFLSIFPSGLIMLLIKLVFLSAGFLKVQYGTFSQSQCWEKLATTVVGCIAVVSEALIFDISTKNTGRIIRSKIPVFTG